MNVTLVTEARRVCNNKSAKCIIEEAREFKRAYKNPMDGIPKSSDFNWYVLGKVDELHEKYDAHTEKLFNELAGIREDIRKELKEMNETTNKEIKTKISGSIFWKINALMFTLIVIILGIIKFG